MILVILALLFILKFNSPSVYIDYLIGLVLVLCAASAIYTLWMRYALHLEVDTQIGPVHEGESFRITVRVVSPELFGKLQAAVELRNLHRNTRVTEKHILTEHRTELSFSGFSSGTVELTIPYVKVYGAFGILGLKKRDVFYKRFNVYPKDGPSPDRHIRMSYLPGAGEFQNAKGDDYTEIYEVRPLQEGDDLRHIHRQLSARFDEYIVKVGSDSRRPVYVYYVDDLPEFPEMSDRVAQMFTLKKNLDNEEGSLMAAEYRGRIYEIIGDPQLCSLADIIYENCLPEDEKSGGKAR